MGLGEVRLGKVWARTSTCACSGVKLGKAWH